MNGEGGERLAAVVAVPDDDFVGAAREEAVDGRVDLAGEELAHLLVGGLGLVLAADAADALGVGDQEDGSAGLRGGACGQKGEAE